MIPTWRRSIVDDPDHYSYLKFNQLTRNASTDVEQRQRSSASDGDEGMNQEELASLHQPPASHSCTNIGSNQMGSRVGAEIVEQPPNGNHGILEQPQQLHDHNYLRSEENWAVTTTEQQHEGEVNGLSVLEEPRKPQRPHSESSSRTERSDLGSNPEVTAEHSEANSSTGDPGEDENYDRLDPAEVEELRRRANIPHEYAGLTGGHSDRRSRGGVMENKGYEGLNPDEVEEFRLLGMQH